MKLVIPCGWCSTYSSSKVQEYLSIKTSQTQITAAMFIFCPAAEAMNFKRLILSN